MRNYIMPVSVRRNVEEILNKRYNSLASTKGITFKVCTRVIEVYRYGKLFTTINYTKRLREPRFRIPVSERTYTDETIHYVTEVQHSLQGVLHW